MSRVELSASAVILAAYALWVFGMYVVALLRSMAWRKRDSLSQELLPQIRETLINYLAGSDNRAEIREYAKQSRRDLGDAMLGFQGTVSGGARDRLCELALEQALVHEWCQDAHSSNVIQRRTAFERLSFVCSYEPCRRVAGDILAQALTDDDAEVRFSAALAVLQSGGAEDIERVFDLALTHDLLARILLAEELRRHSGLLCQRAIPAVLASEDYDAVLAALEMLVAWERALPLTSLGTVLHHPNREIRMQALKLTPLVPLTPETQGAILDSLADPDVEIAIIAAQCAGRLRIEAAMAGLARSLRRGQTDLARAAAAALASLPGRGLTTLQELSTSENPITAEAALEALNRAQGKAGA